MFVRKSSTQSTINPHSRNLKPLAGFGNTHALALYFDEAVRFLISFLLFACCPTTIIRRVIAIIVAPVECVCRRRTFAHIGKEILETIAPAFANTNPLRSVPLKIRPLRLVTSAAHVNPNAIFRRAFHAVLICPSLCNFRRYFTRQATAALRFSGPQIGDLNAAFDPAIAPAKPFAFTGFKHRPAAESLLVFHKRQYAMERA